MTAGFNQVQHLMAAAPVISVITLDRLEWALPLARALLAGGLPVLEITLRTPVALDAIQTIRRELPEALVGAGTVLRPDQIDAVARAGGQFCVSPGSTPSILARARDAQMQLLPGAVTATEIMNLLDQDVTHLKFFPAETSGGAAALKSFAAPFTDVHFCPTGGINLSNAPTYLALPNVRCVGGAWVCPKEWMAQGRWSDIEAAAREAAGLGVKPNFIQG